MNLLSPRQRQFGSLSVLSFTVFACIMLMAVTLLLITAQTFMHFWPNTVYQVETHDGEVHIGKLSATKETASGVEYQLEVGNRDIFGADYIWVPGDKVRSMERLDHLMRLERRTHGNFYGIPLRLAGPGGEVKLSARETPAAKTIRGHLREAQTLRNQREKLLKQAIPLYQNSSEPQKLERLESEMADIDEKIAAYRLTMATSTGEERDIPLGNVVSLETPNAMNVFSKTFSFIGNFWRFIWDEPRESNTEGGIYPALIGTVMLVMIMTVAVVPIGVLVAVYMNEYARNLYWVRFVRMAMNNLAGVPSIVFGMFGLGFFVYTIGGSLDSLFYADALPAPTFGTGGLFWASLTLALLTIPVVVVSTEEGLRSVPRSLRDSSYALGGTRLQTLMKVTLPGALPGILTGIILAVSRGAGEVAPLMLTGVVKLVSEPPIDGIFPFLHLDRKFMHLGFHIFDAGFQSPNAEAARPMVFATAFFLILVVLILNFTAIFVRQYLKTRNKGAVL